jgi:DNA-directed RNA polymerase delta subunit
MNIQELINAIGRNLLTPSSDISKEIKGFYETDLMSDVFVSIQKEMRNVIKGNKGHSFRIDNLQCIM